MAHLSEMSTNMKIFTRAKAQFEESIAVKKVIFQNDMYFDTLAKMASQIASSIEKGGKLLLCGNGGSASDSQHLACELLIRLRSDLNREGLPALSLATDTSTITACANDYEFGYLYERMVNALGQRGDVLLGLTTSGRSENVIRALKAAQSKNMVTLGFLGNEGGDAKNYCDLSFIVPAKDSGRVQEVHITAGHILMDLIEQILLSTGYIRSL